MARKFLHSVTLLNGVVQSVAFDELESSDLPPGGGGAVSDGDYGDITVSGSGTVWTLDIVSTFGRTLIDDADAATARTTLGLGTAATQPSGAFAAAAHAHSGADITSGTVDADRLGSGTTDNTTFLRGDNAWVTLPSTTGGVSNGLDTSANRPAAGSTGYKFQSTDSPMTWRDNGSTYDLVHPIYVPNAMAVDLTDAGTWTNTATTQITSTTKVNEATKIQTNSTGAFGLSAYRRALPSAPFTLTAVIQAFLKTDGAGSAAFVGLHDTGTDDWTTFAVYGVANVCQLTVDYWAAANSFSATRRRTPYNVAYGQPVYLRIVDNNTNWVFSFSLDGSNYNQHHSMARNAGMTPNAAVLGVWSNSGTADDDHWCWFYGYSQA